MQRALWAVAAMALACLLWRAAGVGLAGDYIDPVSKVTAQDEALYASSAIRMARHGSWLTPVFMGRYALYKPPLLLWASGFSARVLGVSRLALRLPVAFLCALAAGLIFLWAAEARSPRAGACAALLLVSNHLWHVLGTAVMTDGLLVAFSIAAMYSLFADPWLESRLALWGFAASTAAAILTKSVAGVLPLGVLTLYWLAAPRGRRPPLSRACQAAGLALALAAPWFVYQLAVNGRWFWTEHIAVEILGYGTGAPPQTSGESHAAFYLVRMALVDPVLLAVAVVASPGFVSALRKRDSSATLLAAWMAVSLAAVFAWQYRNIAYLLPLMPALAVAAAAYGPFQSHRQAGLMVALLGLALAGKAASGSAPWGIAFPRGTVNRVAPVLSDYCRRSRGTELIVAGVDDDLYASALPLAKVRYCLIGAQSGGEQYGMPFESMGIVLTASEFDDLARRLPVFRERLRAWGLNSGAPIGSVILAASADELAQVIRAHPSSDFLVANAFRPAVDLAATHQAVDAGDYVFLLSRTAPPAVSAPAWPCGL